MDDRIPTDVWVAAKLRYCATQCIPVYVVHRGAYGSGTVIVKIVMDKTCKIFNQMRDMDGNMGWMQVFGDETVEEKRADDYIRRSIERDPDVWVIEVEDRNGNNPFEE